MATNLALDDKLLEEARIVGKHSINRVLAVTFSRFYCLSSNTLLLFISKRGVSRERNIFLG
jgi:hypothetical protein